MAVFPITTKTFASTDLVNPLGTFTSAISAGGENLVNGISQKNYVDIAEADSAALATFGSDPIDKYVLCYQISPVTGTTIKIASFIVKKKTDEFSDGRRYIRLSGPSKFYELTNLTLGNTYIAHRDTGTISAVNLTNSSCRIVPGDADYKSDDYYNGWTIETDSGYIGFVDTYIAATGNISLAGNWEPPDYPTSGDTYYLKSGPTIEDVDQVMEFAPAGWSVNYKAGGATGTQEGTTFVAADETVFDGLKNIQKQSGECFVDTDNSSINRAIYWVNIPATGAGTFRNDVSQAQFEAGTYIPIERITSKRADMDRVTRVRAYGHNNLPIKEAYGHLSVPDGFSVDFDNNVITNTTAESAGASIRYGVARFPSIKAVRNEELSESEDEPEVRAAIAVFNAAIQWLTAKAEERYEYVIDCYPRDAITPGQYYNIDYNGDTYITASAFVHRIRTFINEDGYLRTTVYLSSNHHEEPKTGSASVANLLHDMKEWQRHYSESGGFAVGISGSGSGTSELGDHAHASYLLKAGDTITGNISVDDGITIDDVDISEHVADPFAHHTPYFRDLLKGNNIDIQDYMYGWSVTLKPKVEIEEILRIGRDATIELWDEDNAAYRQLRVQSIDGMPHLVFAEESGWGGLDLFVDFDLEVDSVELDRPYNIEPDTTIDFSNTTSPADDNTYHTSEYRVYDDDGNVLATYDDTETASHYFELPGTFSVTFDYTQIHDTTSVLTSGTRTKTVNVAV